MINNALSLLQLCDSQFPTGAFSHSFGLESYIQADMVHDPESFAEWLDIYLLEQLVYADGLAARFVYEALEEGDLDRIWEMDQRLFVQSLAQETREGTQKMGEQMAKITENIFAAPMLTVYRKRIKQKQSFGHSAIAFTMAGHYLDVPKQTTILYYLYTTIVNLVQNAVRGIPMGQTAGQKLIYAFQPKLMAAVEKIEQLDESEFGAVSPGIELSQMHHEQVNVRIFMS